MAGSALRALRVRPRRSCLYVPGTNVRAMRKARSGAIKADSFIFDLEDAVAASAKDEARRNVAELLSDKTAGAEGRETVVRVNGLDTPWGLDDLAMVKSLAHAVDTVAIPKVESAADVWRVERHLEEFGRSSSSHNMTKEEEDLGLALMIETPKGVLLASEIAGASQNVVCLIMGTSDLTNELRAQHTDGREPMLASLGMCVLAARANEVQVLDGVHLNLSDDESFARACVQGRQMGFDGKTLIHPKTTEVANKTFGVDPEAVSHARRIIDAFSKASNAGEGVCVVDGQLVENLHADGAQRLLDFAEKVSQLDS